MTTTLIKQLAVLAKAPNSSGLFSGRIESNPAGGDSDGERVADWKNLPGEFPLIWSHNYNDPGSEIGTIHVAPDADGRHLNVEGRLDTKGHNPMVTAVHERMLLPSSDPLALRELSIGFAYAPDEVTTDANGTKAIHGAEMLEVSVVHAGAQRTEILEVKARRLQADKQWKQDVWQLKHRIDDLDPASVESLLADLERGTSTLTRLERISPETVDEMIADIRDPRLRDRLKGSHTARDEALRRKLNDADAMPTTNSPLRPNGEIRRLNERLDELAGPTTTNLVKRAAAARQDARDAKLREDAEIRTLVETDGHRRG